jgi:hypothetical protein
MSSLNFVAVSERKELAKGCCSSLSLEEYTSNSANCCFSFMDQLTGDEDMAGDLTDCSK